MYGMDVINTAVILLASGFTVILLSRAAKISPVVGFLLAGVILGPHGFKVIEESETTALLAKLGVVFLLFDIGLHFSVKYIWKLRSDLFGLAPLQVFISAGIFGCLMHFVLGLSPEIAVLAGLSLSLSSTAVVMQLLADYKMLESPVGQTGKSFLIFQDIIAVFLLIYVDSIGSDATLTAILGWATIKTIIAVIAVIILGHYILTPLMKVIIKYDDPEMFTVLGLLIVMVTGLATYEVGLSLSLGAFLAGMVLAETPFRVLLQTELRPFRSLLMALFFITIGMVLDPLQILENAPMIAAIVATIMLVKFGLIAILMRIFKRKRYEIIQVAAVLAQGSEFAFVIFSMAAVETMIGAAFTQEMIAAVAISMLLTPFVTLIANFYSLKVCEHAREAISNCPEGSLNPIGNRPVFIVGLNDVGKTIARGLRAHAIPYIGVDRNRQRFLEAMSAGYIIAYGHPSDLRFWNNLGVSRARALCVATPRYEVAQEITPIINRLYPDMKRYVAVDDSADGVRFATLGMKPFHNKGTPPGLEMACFVLREMGIEENKIQEWTEEEQSAYLDSGKSLSTPENAEIIAA